MDIGRKDVVNLLLHIEGPLAYVWAWSDEARDDLAQEIARMAASCMYVLSRERGCTFECKLAPIEPIPETPRAPSSVADALRLAWRLWREGGTI